MDAAIEQALEQDRTIHITTIGRRSGEPRRIEIWFHNLDGRIYITGLPGRRGWYANLQAAPEFTFHVKGSVQADLRARARPVTEPTERRAVLEPLVAKLGRSEQLDRWLTGSPIVEVEFSDGPESRG